VILYYESYNARSVNARNKLRKSQSNAATALWCTMKCPTWMLQFKLRVRSVGTMKSLLLPSERGERWCPYDRGKMNGRAADNGWKRRKSWRFNTAPLGLVSLWLNSYTSMTSPHYFVEFGRNSAFTCMEATRHCPLVLVRIAWNRRPNSCRYHKVNTSLIPLIALEICKRRDKRSHGRRCRRNTNVRSPWWWRQ
jgi:hypothetical protein